jgi:hypothetical protein
VSGESYYAAPRRLRELLERRAITVYDLALVVWVGTDYKGTYGGFLTNKATIAGVLCCSMKTVQRSLARTRKLDLIRHDLRPGMTNFTIQLGALAVRDPATLDSATGGRVQGHLGQGATADGPDPQPGSGIAPQPTLDPHARKSVYDELHDESRRRTTHARTHAHEPPQGRDAA